MKKVLIIVGVVILSFAISYLSAAFILAEFDPLNWESDERFLLVFFTIIIANGIGAIISSIKQN